MDNNETATKNPGGHDKEDPDLNYTGDLPASQKDLQGQFDTYEEVRNDSPKKQTTVSDLPRQIWLDIYENLDYETYLNMRQTNTYFLNLIDHYIGLRATFNKYTTTDPEVFNFFTGVALNDVQFEDARDKEKFNFYKLLAYPNFLTDVSFTGETNLKLVQDIVINCQCLQLVEMTMDCKVFKDDETDEDDWNPKNRKFLLPGVDVLSPFPPHVAHLKFVECLKLVPGIHSDNNLRSHLILSILRSTKAEDFLKKIIFQCELSEQITLRNVLRITAEVMERHPMLEALFLALLNDEYLMSEGEMETYSPYMDLSNSDDGQELNYFRKRIVATGHKLKIQKMGLAMLNKNMQTIWGDFLKTQHNLVHLSLTVTIGHGTFSQEMFDAFSGTLEQLAIRGKFEEPFDFLHITNCKNLKEICLHNLQENGGGGIVPKCVNLPHAPDDLESLILFQVVTRTEDIREVVRKLEKLTTLVVFKCGHAAGETGIGLRCLQEILNKRSLQSVLMVQFICGSTQEAEALAGVLYNMAQDSENQAGPMGRRRRNIMQQPVPPNEPENLLDLREIEDGGDELLFAVGGGGGGAAAHHAHIGREHELHLHEDNRLLERRSSSPHIERPVSRGRHRSADEIGEALVLDEPEAGPSNPVSTQPDSTDNSNEGGIKMEDVEQSKPQESSEFSLDAENFPPLPEPDSTPEPNSNVVPEANQAVEPERGNLREAENTGNVANGEEDEEDSIPEIVVDVDDENDDAAINMLQNILDHAMAGGPEQARRNPNLQQRMNLDRLIHQQMDEDIELILDVGDQELGPVLDLFAAERLAREHNVQVGFILDGVIDIMNEDAVRSKWLCVEDSDGHITYTLKISVEL